MNTRLDLMYRDADNFKAHVTVVLGGELTDEMAARIYNALDEGQYLIADQVGLPTPSEQFRAEYEFPTESDHVWSTLCLAEAMEIMNVAEFLTDLQPTISMTIEEFARKMSEVTFNERQEMERLGMDTEYYDKEVAAAKPHPDNDSLPSP